MKNLLNQEIEYKIKQTSFGEWRSYMYPSGYCYHEFTSHARFFDLPLLHYTNGICPESGRRKVAKGVIAVGRIAIGIIAIGQLSFGIIAIGQLSFAVLLALAQAAFGWLTVGQISVAVYFAIGQFAAGYIAVGQFAVGYYVLAQLGFGEFIWSTNTKDPEAVRFFMELWQKIKNVFIN